MTNRIVRVVLRGDITGLKASLAAASKSVADTSDRLTGATKESAKFRAGLTTMGNTAGKVGLVAAAGLGAVVAAAANFDSAMSKVQAATHESEQNMERLREAAIKAGADTVYSASEAAGAIEALAKAGVSTSDVLAGGLDGALNLAAAGGLEVADAAEVAATALTQFQLAGSDVPHVADLLAAAAGKAQGDVSDMGMALKQSGLVASQMGLSIEETTGTLAAFASAGLLGSDAGTSFRTMLLRLANPTDESRELMERLGITAYDATGKFIGMEAIAQQLVVAFKDKGQAERDSALATIFGSDAIRGASVLYSQGAAGIAEWTDKVDDAGYAAETAATRMDNLKGDLEQLRGSLETALIGAGEGSQGPLRQLVQGLTGVVNAFNDLPGPAKNAASGLLAVTAVVGGGLWFTSRTIKGIADTRVALTNLGIEGTRVGRTLRSALSVGAILAGLDLLDAGLDRLFNTDLDTSKLGRSLDALAQGRITGEIADKFGKDLDKFGQQAIDATGAIENLGDVGGEVGRTLRNIPFAGGFLGGPVDDSINNIEKLDDALASMVESGEEAAAAAIFERFKTAANDAGVSTGNLNKLFGNYRIAVDNTKGATEELTGATTDSTTAQNAAALAAEQAAADQKAAAEALKAARDAARETARQFFGLGDSVDDASVSLGDWLTQLEQQAKALRDFTANARRAGERGLRQGLIRELEAAGPAGALRMKQLADGTDKEIRRANRAWRLGQGAVREYVNTVGGVPPSVATELKLRENDVAARIRAIKAQAEGVAKEYRLSFIVTQTNAANKPRQQATGGYITGPGTATSDSIPAYLSDGEYVVRAAAVAKYGTAMFDSLNAMRYASGGAVRRAGGGRVGDDEPLRTGRSLKRLREELEKAKAALERETKVRDDLTSKRQQLASDVASSLTTELFTSSRSPFAAQGGIVSGALATLRTDIARANQYTALEKQLSSRGLSGDALAALVGTGDVSVLSAFAAASSADLRSFQTMFGQRAGATARAGDQAGVAFAKEQAKSTRQLVLLRREVRRLEKAVDRSADRVGKKINGAASAGRRRARR